MSDEPEPVPPAEAVRKLLHALARGVRHDEGLTRALTDGPWPLGPVLHRATELELIRGRHLTDAGRLVLGEPVYWRSRRAAEARLESANFAREHRCYCGSCVETGCTTLPAPYYPLSLREGR